MSLLIDLLMSAATARVPLSNLQGIGAVIGVTAEKQAKHPGFVLTHQVPCGNPMTQDGFTLSSELDTIKKLLDDLVNR